MWVCERLDGVINKRAGDGPMVVRYVQTLAGPSPARFDAQG